MTNLVGAAGVMLIATAVAAAPPEKLVRREVFGMSVELPQLVTIEGNRDRGRC